MAIADTVAISASAASPGTSSGLTYCRAASRAVVQCRTHRRAANSRSPRPIPSVISASLKASGASVMAIKELLSRQRRRS
jgi:hypothetical protein